MGLFDADDYKKNGQDEMNNAEEKAQSEIDRLRGSDNQDQSSDKAFDDSQQP